MVDSFFANNYTHLPGQTIGNIDQGVNYVRGKEAKEEGKGEGTKGKGKGYNDYYNYNYNNYYNQRQQQPQQKGKNKGKGPTGSYDRNNKGKSNQKGDKNNKGKGNLHRRPLPQSVGFVAKLDIELQLAGQQPKERQQQHPTTAATSTTSAVPATRHIRSADLLHASRRHRYAQLPAVTTTTTTSTMSTSSSSTTFCYFGIIYNKVVHPRTNHLRHQCYQYRGHLKEDNHQASEHPSPLQHQPAESRTSLRSTTRTSSSQGKSV